MNKAMEMLQERLRASSPQKDRPNQVSTNQMAVQGGGDDGLELLRDRLSRHRDFLIAEVAKATDEIAVLNGPDAEMIETALAAFADRRWL